ncbi:FliC/FljB family flagellin [Kushneria sp. AK178]
MAMVINTNALSLNAQNNLNKSQQSLNTAIERLSSGSRINSAKDDAAGLAISNRMNAQVTGLNQANRNANDGISAAQTAEGALGQVTDNLQRIRELTVQSQNGTLTDTDKTSIQEEITQRLEEIDRISEQTQFNGKNLLDGSNSTLKIQVGANDGQTIDLNMVSVETQDLGVKGFQVGGTSGALTSIDTDDGSGKKTSTQIGGIPDGYTLHGVGEYDSEAGTYDNYALKNSQGDFYAIETPTDFTDISTEAAAATGDLDAAKTAYEGYESAATANPLKAIDDALAKVDSARSTLGAQQNRLQSTVEGNATTSTNLSAAMSQIKDADYATEVSNMSKAQILQQAGTSVLAQANQTTQGVMSLLR